MTAHTQHHDRLWFHRIAPRHGAFVAALLAGGIAAAAAFGWWPDLALTIGTDAALTAYLAVVFIELPRLTPDVLRRHADEEAPPIGVVVAVTLAIIGVGVYALFAALNSGSSPGPLKVGLGVLAVVLGWFVINTMAAMHYAYEYYESPAEAGGGLERRGGHIAGGFDWPEGEDPDGYSFIYLAYQVGSAYQLSDVPATSNRMRRILVVHSTIAYFYGTLMLAATINVIMAAAGAGG